MISSSNFLVSLYSFLCRGSCCKTRNYKPPRGEHRQNTLRHKSQQDPLWLIFFIGSLIFLELSCRSCLYIFETSCLSVASFAIIFSHSEGCLFTLLIVSFIVQKLLSLVRSHLFIFAFISSILGGGSRGSCCDLCRRVFCLCSLGVL